jgi:Na+-translocating ferredoxin:NAD+ oxidoreductase subunit B
MLIAVVALTGLGLVLGLILGLAAQRLAVEGNPIVSEVEALMPGSQCGQCGFAGCSQAAGAIAEGAAPLNACPPGGQGLAVKIAALLGVSFEANPEEQVVRTAFVDEAKCIGCMKCFQVCPTDAVVGAPKQIHGVIQEHCTACKACVDVCPTEAMHVEALQPDLNDWRWPKPIGRSAA